MITLESISQSKHIRAPRIILLGVEKIGKTSFACGCRFDPAGALLETGLNAPVVIPCKGEEGTDGLGVPTFPICDTANKIMQCISALYDGKHQYRTVVLDSSSAAEPLIHDAVCNENSVKSIEKVGGGYGKGYIEALRYWRDVMTGFDALRNEHNMTSIIIGHVRVRRFDDPNGDSYDTYAWDIHDKAASALYKWADIILFANTKVVIRKEDIGFSKTKSRGIDATGGQRFLFTQKRPAHPGGGRHVYGRLPYELPLDWTTFENTIASAMQPQGEKNHE